ncbi:HAMP domain-containing sensor histidine kinase [uncultured Bacteroides sp.]|uniref:sensor histidine kinase n=1 Tax=uncultured Bacteroides sp. TaxID=162156 RepID=UPI002AAAA756|nr:HAMP domain-containing sensor histidine kinase [uncultured Bacteroides sp.]
MISLLKKNTVQFMLCIVIILTLSTPLFYFLTRYYYAEDLIEVIENAQKGNPLPQTDLEEDIFQGILLQFILILLILGLSVLLTSRFISKRLWRPFDKTLSEIEHFSLEKESLPVLPQTDILEFNRLNTVLTSWMKSSMKKYQAQKEFTENASHELQTPLAVALSKLDLLLQQPDLSAPQVELLRSLYDNLGRLSRLNKDLLLLARIDNRQYNEMENINVTEIIENLISNLSVVAGDKNLIFHSTSNSLILLTNKTLFESLMLNLIINAIRHTKKNGEITISLDNNELTVANASDEPPLDESLLFKRFYFPSSGTNNGNGLGLSIIKAICDYHGWTICYRYLKKEHRFILHF